MPQGLFLFRAFLFLHTNNRKKQEDAMWKEKLSAFKNKFFLPAVSAILPARSVFAESDAAFKDRLRSSRNEVEISRNTDVNTELSSLLGFLTYIAWFVGAVLIAAAVLTYLRAKYDENAVRETNAIIMLVAGIVFIMFGAILRVMFG